MQGEYGKDQVAQLLARPALTVADALKVIPLSRNGLYEAIRRGDIQTVKLGKKILVPTGPLRRQFGIEG
jgi:hypothetical protein